MKVVATAEAEVKKYNGKDAQDDDDSVRSSLLSPPSLSLSPPVLPSYAVDAIEAIYSSSIKMKEVPRSNSWCAKNSNPCSSSRSSSNPSPSNCIKTEVDADSTNSSSSSNKSSDDINVEEVAEDFYNNNTLFFALTNVQQQQQQQQEVITTTTDAKALLKTSNATTINSAIIDVVDDDNNNDDETETETFGNCDDSSNGEENEENGDDLEGETDADFGPSKGSANKLLSTSKKPTVAVTVPSFLPASKKHDASAALPVPERVTIKTMTQEHSELQNAYEVLARELEVVKVAFARQMKQQQEVIHQQQTTIAGQQQQIVQLQQRKQTSVTSDYSGSNSDNDDDAGGDDETTKVKKRKSESESESDDDELPKKKKKYVSTSSTVHTGVKNAIWNENFQQLLAYKEEHGNTHVPRKHPQLGAWVCDQRYLYTIKNLSNIRFQQLQNMGFVWSPRDALWTKMYHQLQSYQTRHHGSTQVLASCKENPSLGYWVQTQRKAYHNDTLLLERMELLNALDFVYELPTRK